MGDDGTEKKGVNIELPPPPRIVITPVVMAQRSEDFHKASESYRPEKGYPVINHFLYLVSIELGLKSAILSVDCSKDNIEKLKKKPFGHNLLKCIEEFEKITGNSLFDKGDIKALEDINTYYKNKGLEYFTADMMPLLVTAYKGLPDIDTIRTCSKKVNEYLVANKYFVAFVHPS